jgi:hypothetical protein
VEWFTSRFVTEQLETVARETTIRRDRLEERLAENATETLDSLSAGNFETLLADRPVVTIFPVHLAGTEHAVMLPGEAYILCGTAFIDAVVPAERGQGEWERRTDELLKAIGDPNRLAMLRLLRRRPHYGKELADELGISPGTISFHLEKLVSARLARLELSGVAVSTTPSIPRVSGTFRSAWPGSFSKNDGGERCQHGRSRRLLADIADIATMGSNLS